MRHWPGEHGKGFGCGKPLLFLAQSRCAIRERDHIKTAFVSGAHSRFDTAICKKPGERNVLDTPRPEDEIQIGTGKAIQSPFAFNHNIAFLGLQFFDDLSTPSSFSKCLGTDNA